MIVAGLALIAGLCVSIATSASSVTASADPTSGLSERQLAGQMIVYSYLGRTPPRALKARIRRGEVGGVILFTRNIGSRGALRASMRALQRAASRSGVPGRLPIMIDQEGGLVKRLSGAPRHSAGELGRIGRAALARSEGAATARNLRSVGVNVNLAPVLDVGRPGSYQRRTGRSFGGSARAVSTLGSAFVRGLQSGQVAATLKHFPGLGTVRSDEDQIAQRVSLSKATLRAVDELPFTRATGASARLVMTSTAIYPAFSSSPAMFSSALSKDELREHVGFKGVAITDDIEVPAMRRFGSPPSLGLRAARAGNDMLLFAQRYRNAAKAHRLILRSLGPDRLRKSARRVIALRKAL